MASPEQNIEKLKALPFWGAFTEPQQVFLNNAAMGAPLEEAYLTAYPNTSQKTLLPSLGITLSKVRIKKALEAIGINNTNPIVSKQEAMELLSKHLRKTEDPTVVVKLLGTYSKIAGWDVEPDADDEIPLDKLVAAVEKKRKQA